VDFEHTPHADEKTGYKTSMLGRLGGKRTTQWGYEMEMSAEWSRGLGCYGLAYVHVLVKGKIRWVAERGADIEKREYVTSVGSAEWSRGVFWWRESDVALWKSLQGESV
jgi:hypothetical protein